MRCSAVSVTGLFGFFFSLASLSRVVVIVVVVVVAPASFGPTAALFDVSRVVLFLVGAAAASLLRRASLARVSARCVSAAAAAAPIAGSGSFF